MTIGVKIRNGRINDKKRVLNIWEEMMEYHITISSIDYEMVKNAPELFMKFYENNVRSTKKIALVAEVEKTGKIVGYILGTIHPRPPLFKTTHQAFITDTAVSKNKRNLGVGTKLLAEFITWAKEKGMKYITLNVVPENESGKQFWKKHGFKTVLLGQRKII